MVKKCCFVYTDLHCVGASEQDLLDFQFPLMSDVYRVPPSASMESYRPLKQLLNLQTARLAVSVWQRVHSVLRCQMT